MNINNFLLERAKSDTLTNNLLSDSDKKVIHNDILFFIMKRIENKISQTKMSNILGVSLRTLQRFEKFEVNDLILYLNYKYVIEQKDLRFI